MYSGLIALALGLLSLRVLPALPSLQVLFVLVLLVLALLWKRWFVVPLFLLGLVWACASAQLALNDQLASSLDGTTHWLEGTVVGLPEQTEGVQRFEIVAVTHRKHVLPQRIRLSWYDGPALRAGERWRLAVTLKRPRGSVNPHGFDYEAWLLAQRIGATGTVKAGIRVQEASGVLGWRDQLRAQLLAVPAQGRSGALAALVLGDDSGLSVSDWQVLQDTGTVHLLVISGQHIVLLAAILYAFVAGLARLGWWPLALPWLPTACIVAFLGALAYAGLAGFEVPVRRACIMLAVVLFWRWRYQNLGAALPFLLALNAVLLIEPLATLQPGFWLSFAAVAILIYVFRGRLGGWSITHAWWRAQWTLALGLLPFLLSLGLPVSFSGLGANLLAVPLVSLLIVPLALLGSALLYVPWLGSAVLWLAGGLLVLLFDGLAWLAAWAPAWTFAAVPWWALLSGLLGVLVLLLPAGMVFRPLGAVFLLPLLWPPIHIPVAGHATVWVLDVGQGSVVLVQTKRHALLFDAGPRQGGFDHGARTVLPALRHLGITQLDQLLLSHADLDHSGGALAIHKAMPVGVVYSGEADQLPASLKAQSCPEQSQWGWDGVWFRVWRWQKAPEGNAASCILQIDASGERLLLTGDIDQATEAALLASTFPVASDWFMAPHHGSKNSSSGAFLQRVAAHSVVISRGYRNTYGHPHPSVSARYAQAQLTVYDTALDGALRIELGSRSPAQGMRAHSYFWRTQ